MRNVRNFTIDGFESLQTLSVGENSFLLNSGARNDGECIISNCPALQEINFKQNALAEFNILRLRNLESLHTVILNLYNFRYGITFEMNSNQ